MIDVNPSLSKQLTHIPGLCSGRLECTVTVIDVKVRVSVGASYFLGNASPGTVGGECPWYLVVGIARHLTRPGHSAKDPCRRSQDGYLSVRRWLYLE